MYEGWIDTSGRLRSLANHLVGSISLSRGQECSKYGNGWQVDDWSDAQMIKDLMILIGRTNNVDKKYGYGYANNGELVTKGEFSGKYPGGVKIFWMEGFISGAVGQNLNGVMHDTARGIVVKMYPPYNTTGTGYITAYPQSKMPSGGNIGKTLINEYGEFPATSGASATTYFCTYYLPWGGNLQFGGSLADGAAGFYYAFARNTTSALGSDGANVACKPIVS